jgi:hypothetical protein
MSITNGKMRRWKNNVLIHDLANNNERPQIPFATDEPNGRTVFINSKSHATVPIDGIESSPRDPAGGTWDGVYIEPMRSVGTDASDDNMIFALDASIATAGTFTYKNVITTPVTGNNAHGGSVVTVGGSGTLAWGAALKLVAEQNTVHSIGSNNAVVAVEHSALLPAQECVVSRNNLTYALSTVAGGALISVSSVADGSLTADHNWTWNTTGNRYNGVGGVAIPPQKYTATPGTGDQTGDPGFADVNRRFLGFITQYVPSATTLALAFEEFSKRVDGRGGDARISPSLAFDWLRAGFAPSNAAIMTAGSTGGRVGAVDVAAPTGPTTPVIVQQIVQLLRANGYIS